MRNWPALPFWPRILLQARMEVQPRPSQLLAQTTDIRGRTNFFTCDFTCKRFVFAVLPRTSAVPDALEDIQRRY
jgi:hypothetical protein